MATQFDTQAALKDILSFMQEAGDLALKNQATAAHEFKTDNSIVTETDLAITQMAKEKLAKWYQQPGHTLIDEESLVKLGTPEEVFSNSEYLWILDPIDGTANYACGRHIFGTLLTVLKGGQPCISVMYQPKMKELVYATIQEGAFYTCQAFTGQSQTRKINKIDYRPLHPQVFFDFAEDELLGAANWHEIMWINTPGAAINSGITTALGRNSGCLVSHHSSIWDVAPNWSIHRQLNVNSYLFHTQKPIEKIHAGLFEPNWKITDSWFFGTQGTLETLHQHISKSAA